MTISTTASSVTVAGNGATASFGFSFIAGTASNIVVTYTDANSNATVLVQGSQYTLSINAAAAGQIWGVGGTVTYPLSGSPIAAGTYLTISRIVPVTQLTSISNQGDFYPQSVEKALDTLEMQIQQVASQIGRALLFNIADTGPFGTLPIASVRAGMILGFDSNGNPGVYEELPAGSVSAAMGPVVEAASVTDALRLLMVGQAGTFTNSQMNDANSFLVNGLNTTTEFQWSHPANYATEALAAGIIVPDSSTVYTSTAIAGYVQNGATNAAGATVGTFYGRNTVAGATIYGINPLVTDQNSAGTSGVQSTVVGAEFDIGAFNTATVAYGINMIGVFPNGTPETAVAFQVAKLNAPWGYGFIIGDGAANVAIDIGAAGTGANNDGMPINLVSRDGSNTPHIVGIQAQHTSNGANLVLNTPDGGVVLSGLESVGGAANFSADINVTATSGNLASFFSGTTLVGGISTNGASTTYNTTSDRRLKDIHGPADASVIDKLQVYTASFKAHPDVKRTMLIADEAQLVAPWMVTGVPNAVHAAHAVTPSGVTRAKAGDIIPQMVDHSALVPDLIAKCQSLQAQVSALVAEVTALKAKVGT